MTFRLLCCAWMLCLLAGTAGAQALERDPGFVDLVTIESWFDSEPNVVVNIKGALLNLVAEASRYEDPELADLLRKLKAIQVRGFTMRRTDFGAVEERTADLARHLEASGWDTVVRVREVDNGERVDVFVRVANDAIAGMMVMVVDSYEDETFFVNIVGEIDPAQIGRIGRTFDIDPLRDGLVDH